MRDVEEALLDLEAAVEALEAGLLELAKVYLNLAVGRLE